MAAAAPATFSLAQRVLHWATVLLVAFNLLFSDNIAIWQRAIRRTGAATPDQVASANVHAYVGIAILVLALLRLVLRVTHGVPAAPPQEPKIFQLAASVAHVGLYLALLAMPISGMLAYYLGIRVAGDVHADIIQPVFWVLIGAHVVGALAQHFYWKTDVLRRMTTG